jgi:hypothetical protein
MKRQSLERPAKPGVSPETFRSFQGLHRFAFHSFPPLKGESETTRKAETCLKRGRQPRNYSGGLNRRQHPWHPPFKALGHKASASKALDAAIREGVAAALPRRAARGRDVDAALADAVEGLPRLRARPGCSGCTRSDGKIVRLIFETLGRMLSQSDTNYLGFG